MRGKEARLEREKETQPKSVRKRIFILLRKGHRCLYLK